MNSEFGLLGQFQGASLSQQPTVQQGLMNEIGFLNCTQILAPSDLSLRPQEVTPTREDQMTKSGSGLSTMGNMVQGVSYEPKIKNREDWNTMIDSFLKEHPTFFPEEGHAKNIRNNPWWPGVLIGKEYLGPFDMLYQMPRMDR